MTDTITKELSVIGLSDNHDCNRNAKRKEYLEWDEYFMAVSFLSAMRSKDPATQVAFSTECVET